MKAKILLFCTVMIFASQSSFAQGNSGTNNALWQGIGSDTVTTNRQVTLTKNMKTQQLLADSAKVTRFLPADGDSIIHFGENSIQMMPNINKVSWTPAGTNFFCFGQGIRGLAIANGSSLATGNNSMALGNNVITACNAENSFAVGQGVTNSIANSFQLGFSGVTLFADATRVGIRTISPTQTLDVNGTANIRTVAQNNALTQVLVRDPNNLGLIQWRDAATLGGAGTFWQLGGNTNASPTSILGSTSLFVPLNIYAGGIQRGFIDGTSGFWGIGSGFTPTSLLHINGNSSSNPTGNVFRTDGPSTQTNTWRMFTGITPKFSVINPSGSNNVVLEAGMGDMIFNAFDNNTQTNTKTPVERMRITSGGTIAQDQFGNYDGLRIFSSGQNFPSPNVEGPLDIWVAGANNTNIRWDGSGLIRGSNSRFELFGNMGGIYMNARRTLTPLGVNPGVSPQIQFDITPELVPNLIPYATSALPEATAVNVGVFAFDGDGNGAFDGNFGVNQLNPQNRVEITGNSQNPFFNSVNGQSGLRLTNMTSANTPMPNPGTGVLSVDEKGDVIYVPGSTGSGASVTANNGLTINPAGNVQLGQQSGIGSGADLLHHTDVPLANKYLAFTGQGLPGSGNAVGIGMAATAINPNTKLDVLQTNNEVNAGNFISTGNKISPSTRCVLNAEFNGFGSDIDPIVAVCGSSVYSLTTQPSLIMGIGGRFTGGQVGSFSQATGVSGVTHYGVLGAAYNGSGDNYGGYFEAKSSSTPLNTGVLGTASGANGSSSVNIGGAFLVNQSADANIGVFASSSAGNPSVSGSYAGVFVGPVAIFDASLSLSWSNPSDSELKTNVQPMTNGLSVIKSINPISFNYNGKAGFSRNKNYIGVVAEEVASFAPYAVDTFYAKLDSSDTSPSALLSVKSEAIMYTAINAIKELDSTVTAMQANTGGVSGTGTENYLTKWQDEHTVTNSQIIDNGNSIGIGTTPTNAKVSIHSEDRPQGLQVSNISSGASASFPFYPVSPYNQLSIPTTYGIRSSATTAENPLNIANSSFASSGQINVGGLFLSQSNVNTNPDATSMGLFSHGYGGDQNYGIYAAAQGNINPNPSFNYGIYATADLNGISSAPGSVSYAGYFNGDVAVNGSLTSPSDEMLKENIQDINGASEVLKQLRPRTFQFKTQDFPSMNLPAGVRYGLIAQEVETVLPELIGMSVNPSPTDSAGNPAGTSVSYKSANYEAFIPILIKGFQEQLSANDSLKEQMATLQQQINAMQECINNLPQGMGCSNARTDNSGNSTTEPETQRIALENTLPAILYQNEPNPFGSSTLIRYYVSESTKEAMLLFHDEFGREIGRENIQQKGYGKAEINSQKLSVGIYTYSLIIDGKVADTKKMVKQ